MECGSRDGLCESEQAFDRLEQIRPGCRLVQDALCQISQPGIAFCDMLAGVDEHWHIEAAAAQLSNEAYSGSRMQNLFGDDDVWLMLVHELQRYSGICGPQDLKAVMAEVHAHHLDRCFRFVQVDDQSYFR